MELRQLRYVMAVAEELNFTRAARRCNVSQPPLSRAISDLEIEIGVRLFDRDTHRVSLTAAGSSLLDDARRALELLDGCTDRARRVAMGLKGTLVLGFGGSPVYALLPNVIRRFRSAAPDVRLRFRSMAVLQQIEALRDGQIDIGIVRLPVHDEILETQSLHREPLIVALPTKHALLAAAGPVQVRHLAGQPFIAYEPRRGFNYHADLLALCRLAGFDPLIVHEAATTEAIIGMVACGEGVAIVPESAKRLRFDGVNCRPLDVKDVPLRLRAVEFALAWRREDVSPVAIEFVNHARSWSKRGSLR
jgi:DNA-binding transcriptional LysR family regulator